MSFLYLIFSLLLFGNLNQENPQAELFRKPLSKGASLVVVQSAVVKAEDLRASGFVLQKEIAEAFEVRAEVRLQDVGQGIVVWSQLIQCGANSLGNEITVVDAALQNGEFFILLSRGSLLYGVTRFVANASQDNGSTRYNLSGWSQTAALNPKMPGKLNGRVRMTDEGIWTIAVEHEFPGGSPRRTQYEQAKDKKTMRMISGN